MKVKGERRTARLEKRRRAMRVSGRSVFVILRAIVKRAERPVSKETRHGN